MPGLYGNAVSGYGNNMVGYGLPSSPSGGYQSQIPYGGLESLAQYSSQLGGNNRSCPLCGRPKEYQAPIMYNRGDLAYSAANRLGFAHVLAGYYGNSRGSGKAGSGAGSSSSSSGSGSSGGK